ncbi:MAG: hypothetical protein ABSG43_12580 [Solirubrobacteraceae bacterium]
MTEPRSGSVVGRDPIGEHRPEAVLEHCGSDAEMLTLRSPVTGAVGPSGLHASVNELLYALTAFMGFGFVLDTHDHDGVDRGHR